MPTAVVVGNFDGLHIGHMKLINTMKHVAHEKHLRTVVVSFSPHPLVYFEKVEQFEKILLPEEKKHILQHHEIDYYVELPFNKQLADMAPIEFFDYVLITKLNCAAFIIGSDYCFGKNREGNAETATKICVERGIHIKNVPMHNCENTGKKVSSSLIRALIAEGKLKQASKFLGYDYEQVTAGRNK